MSRHARALTAAATAVAVVAAGCGGGGQPDVATQLSAGDVATTSAPALHLAQPAADPTAGLEANLGTIPPRARATRSSRHRSPQPGGPKPSQATTQPPAQGAAGGWVTVADVTAYCLTGRMANGQPASWGSAASNEHPLGTRLELAGYGTVTVRDRIGHGSRLDLAMPGACDRARAWGRRTMQVRVVGE